MPHSQTQLEKALSGTPTTPIALLSVAHVTLGRSLSFIVKQRQLRPQYCNVLGRKALYLSYGTPHYRPKSRQTQDMLELPVVFVFDPDLLPTFSRFYPFDTGAVAAGIFGRPAANLASKMHDLYVDHEPQRLVSCFYTSNANYLRGQVRRRGSTTNPLPIVRRFLATDLSQTGVDQRQRTIECVSEQPVSLLNHLRFVAFPDTLSAGIRRLWDACSQKFEYHAYEADVNENPAALVTHIAKILRERLAYMWEGPQ